MRKFSTIIFLIYLFAGEIGWTQDLPSLAITARYDSIDNTIMLKWAPGTPNMWLLAIEHGYTVEKYYYQKDNQLLPPPLKKVIVVKNIKPKPLDSWQELALKNDYGAIAAQSLYGKGVNLDDSNGGIVSIVNKSKQNQSRYSFSLFAADQSLEVASHMGLFYEDRKIQKNERYLYRVYVNVPDSVLKADTASVYYGPADYSPLPSPKVESIVQKGNHVELKWLSAPYRNVFSSYQVQRSFDGEFFETVNAVPTIDFNSGPSKRNLFSTYIDTTQYSGTAHYRILGKNTFGQFSVASDTLSIKRLKSFDVPIPQIDSIKFRQGLNNIYWSAKGDTEFVEKIILEKANESEGNYQLVQLDSLIGDYVLKDNFPEEINYYRVGITAGDNINYSLPFLFKNIDSIPPAKPKFSEYFVKDSLLHLSWNANTEEDLAGYRIYKSQKKTAEPSLIYDENKADTVAVFSENLSFINNQRFFYLVAVDRNGNASDLSDRFTVELPDIVPPSPPQIRKIRHRNDSIILDFIESSSRDVESYLLYRRIGKSLYRLIAQLELNTNQYIDRVENEGLYKYRLVALDKAGNEAVSNPYPFNVLFRTERKFQYEIIDNNDSFKILWQIPKNVKASKLKVYYRSNEQYNLIREVDAEKSVLNLRKGTRLKENIKIILI